MPQNLGGCAREGRSGFIPLPFFDFLQFKPSFETQRSILCVCLQFKPSFGFPALDPVCVHRRYRDMQLIVDVVMSGGVPQRRGGPPAGSSQAVQLYFSNPDLLWANEFPRSRFGQGAFAHAVMVRVAWGPAEQGRGDGKGGEEGRKRGAEERSGA